MPLHAFSSRAAVADTSGRRWDPESVLKLSLDGRCVGFAPSKRRKCRMPIPHNAYRVETLLNDLAAQHPDPEELRPKLRRLAEHGLCMQFHQYQVDVMVNRWTRSLNEAFPLIVDRTDERVDLMSGRMRQRPGSSNGMSSTVLVRRTRLIVCQLSRHQIPRHPRYSFVMQSDASRSFQAVRLRTKPAHNWPLVSLGNPYRTCPRLGLQDRPTPRPVCLHVGPWFLFQHSRLPLAMRLRLYQVRYEV
jgi:hypothetical protein